MDVFWGTIAQSMGRILSVVRISDLLDIAIVAFLVYKVTGLVRETRAGQLVKGIVLLLVAMQLCAICNLHVMTYILRFLMQFGVLALIIVFQPELRRALEKLGGTSFFKVFVQDSAPQAESVAEAVAAACAAMKSRKIGALIVFERTTPLGDMIRTGTDLGAANVDAGLLVNIFIPNTPLHDGAVMIRENKVAAAGCILPLSENPHLSQELGTRHRAALGVTENSDAVVAVVSEETGKISFAEHGELRRDLHPDELKKLIFDAIYEPESGRTPGGFFLSKRRDPDE